MIGTLNCSSLGNFSVKITSNPGFCNPIAFSIPLVVSATLGVALPKRGSRVQAFIIMEPNWFKSKYFAYSSPKPKHPLAGMIGFFKSKPGNLTAKRFIIKPPLPL